MTMSLFLFVQKPQFSKVKKKKKKVWIQHKVSSL